VEEEMNMDYWKKHLAEDNPRQRRFTAILVLSILLLSAFAGMLSAACAAAPPYRSQIVQPESTPPPSKSAGSAGSDSGCGVLASGAKYPPVQITIDGPSVLATTPSVGETGKYMLSIKGGPASMAGPNLTVNWSFSAYVKGVFVNEQNKSGPLETKAATGTSNSTGNFTFNVTAPIHECTITLYVNGTSAIVGNDSVTVERTMIITVVKPVTFTAEVHNYGSVSVKNIRVSFYIDGIFIGSKNISSLASNSSKNVSLNWTVADYGIGYHTVRVVITGGGPMVLFSSGGNETSYEFYVGSLTTDPYSKAWLALGVLLLVIVVVMFILAYLSTGRPPPAQPEKK
jgi:hypothetical protein